MGAVKSQFMIADIADRSVGFPVSALYRVLPAQRVTDLPTAKPFVEGCFILEGNAVFVVNLSKRIGAPSSQSMQDARNIVIRVSDGLCAVPVLSVPEIIDLSDYPAEEASEPFSCLARVGTQSLYLLNPELLFPEHA